MHHIQYLLLDLNSFFASCEQQDQPHLRGKPVAIVPMLADGTSVIAASYEAKKYGIKTGTRVFEARKMCPGIQFVAGNHRRYTEYHYRIVDAVNEICPVEKTLSIDEVACRLMGRETQEAQAIKIAQKMKAHIREKVGLCLTSSIGLGPNILIAKMASDLVKPDGLVSVPKEKIGSVFDDLDISVVPGIGRNMKYHLNAKGIFKVKDLRALSSQQLRVVWGSIAGLRLAEELQGKDIARAATQNHALSHEHVLPPQLRNKKGAYEILIKLLSKAGQRLRQSQRKAKTLGIYIKQKNGIRYEDHISFVESDDTFFLLRQMKKLFDQFSIENPIKVSVFLGGLTEEGIQQLSFFSDAKVSKVNQVMDLINLKFGANTLHSAGALEVLSEAKTRISFSHVPRLDDEFE